MDVDVKVPTCTPMTKAPLIAEEYESLGRSESHCSNIPDLSHILAKALFLYVSVAVFTSATTCFQFIAVVFSISFFELLLRVFSRSCCIALSSLSRSASASFHNARL
jgi:hypothetical protein